MEPVRTLNLPYLHKNHADKTTAPTRFGYILFPGVEALDVFGPLEALNLLSLTTYLNLTLIAETLDPVSTHLPPWATNLVNATFAESVLPTHTFETAPDLGVLIVPGGPGTRAPSPILNSIIDFVASRYPSLQYLMTVCTGAGIAARAGVLDYKHATTNKKAWAQTTAWGPKVKWVAHARWVQDGNLWTTSGVSAGIDGTIAFIEYVWGNSTATTVANYMEYEGHLNSTEDPFAALYGLTDANNWTDSSP
jgi:transcriptional regulator GlxA family with amidase domain